MKKPFLFLVLSFFMLTAYAQNFEVVAVLPFRGDVENDLITGKFTAKLSNIGSFALVERSQIDAVIKEGIFQSSYSELETAAELANQVGATSVILGSLSQKEGLYYINLRLVNVERALVIGGTEGLLAWDNPQLNDEQIQTLAEDLVLTLYDQGFPIRDRIIDKISEDQNNRRKTRQSSIEDKIRRGDYPNARDKIKDYLSVYGEDEFTIEASGRLEYLDVEGKNTLGIGGTLTGNTQANYVAMGPTVRYTMQYNLNHGIVVGGRLYFSGSLSGGSIYGGPLFIFSNMGFYPFIGYDHCGQPGFIGGLGIEMIMKKLVPFVELGAVWAPYQINEETNEEFENLISPSLTAGISLKF